VRSLAGGSGSFGRPRAPGSRFAPAEESRAHRWLVLFGDASREDDRERLVRCLSKEEEDLVPVARSAIFSIVASAPDDPATRALVAGLAKSRLAEPLERAAGIALREAVRQARLEAADADVARRTEEAKARRAGEPLETAARALADRLRKATGYAWSVEPHPSPRPRGHPRPIAPFHLSCAELGRWTLVSPDPASPEGLAAVRGWMASCAAVHELVGRGSLGGLITYPGNPATPIVLAALGLDAPEPELASRANPLAHPLDEDPSP
jgi:hypothetical protein